MPGLPPIRTIDVHTAGEPLRGLLAEGQTFTHESIIGTTFRGRVVRDATVAEWPAVVAEIEGEAHVIAECTFLVDERDPAGLGVQGLTSYQPIARPSLRGSEPPIMTPVF